MEFCRDHLRDFIWLQQIQADYFFILIQIAGHSVLCFLAVLQTGEAARKPFFCLLSSSLPPLPVCFLSRSLFGLTSSVFLQGFHSRAHRPSAEPWSASLPRLQKLQSSTGSCRLPGGLPPLSAHWFWNHLLSCLNKREPWFERTAEQNGLLWAMALSLLFADCHDIFIDSQTCIVKSTNQVLSVSINVASAGDSNTHGRAFDEPVYNMIHIHLTAPTGPFFIGYFLESVPMGTSLYRLPPSIFSGE